MDLNHIKDILDLVREHELAEFEIEHEGLRLKIRKDASGGHVVTHGTPVIHVAAAAAPVAPRSGWSWWRATSRAARWEEAVS